LIIRPHRRRSPLFPYTTLFRSVWAAPVYPPNVAWSGTVSQPPLARPAYRQTVVDPVFGSNITRISGDEMNPTNPLYLQHNYSKRSEEHTSELQSRGHLVCRLLL